MPSAFTGDPFGYNKARRDWARQLNIDPYTSNPVLRPLLDNASAASFAGSFAINTAIGAVSMGANLVVGFDTDVRDAVWNQPPSTSPGENESRLLAMGVSGRTTRDFLRNRWFTPSLQTALVIALTKLAGVAGAESVIQVASQVQGEGHVRFLVESIRMLGRYDAKEARLRQAADERHGADGRRGQRHAGGRRRGRLRVLGQGCCRVRAARGIEGQSAGSCCWRAAASETGRSSNSPKAGWSVHSGLRP